MGRRALLAPATLLLATVAGAAGTPARAPDSGGDVAYRPIEAAAPQPLDGAGLRTPEELEAFVDGFVGGELEAYDVAGLTVAVVKDGQLFFAKGYGFSDVDRRVPVEADKTLFRPGSVSKLFTWTAVMQLVEQGKLDLDADVNTYPRSSRSPPPTRRPSRSGTPSPTRWAWRTAASGTSWRAAPRRSCPWPDRWPRTRPPACGPWG
jgi:CubicO group peptidase (beta-lactamase class C family)